MDNKILLGFGWLADKAWEIVSGIFKSVWESLIGPFDSLHGLKTLVFNKYEDGERVYGVFKPEIIENSIAPGIQSMSYVVGFFLVLAIIFAGVRISNTGLNPANRTAFLEFVRDWVIVALVLANLGFFYEMIFMFNDSIVGIVNGGVIDQLDDKLMPDIQDSGLVGWIIIGLFMLGVTVWANWYYMMRRITLMVFMVLGPIFIALYLFPSTKQVTFAWIKEFFGTVMVQSVHAVTMFAIATLADGGESGLIELTIMYLIVIPTGEAVRGLLNLGGDTTGRLSRFAAMAGMAGIAGVYGAVKSATSGKGFGQALRDGVDNVRGNTDKSDSSDSTGAAVGPMAGTDTRSERMLRAGEILSKGGKMVVGGAGALAGAVMGPHGALIGGGLGTALGDDLGGKVGRLGVAAKDKLAQTRDALKHGKQLAMEEQEADRIASELADFQTEEWAKNNFDQFKQEQEEKHGSMDETTLNKLWNAEKAKQRELFKAENKQALLNGGINPDYVRASDLAEQIAQEKFNESLEHDGFDKFKETHGKNMSPDELNEAWEKEKDNRLNEFRKQAQTIAKDLTKGKPMDSFVNKNEFLDRYKQSEMAKFDGNEKAFKDNFMKSNPNATEEDANIAWQNARADHLQKINASANRISANTKGIPEFTKNSRRASDLVEYAAADMTKHWEENNGKAIKEKIHASESAKIEKEIEKEWDAKVSQVRADHKKQADIDTQNWVNANAEQIKDSIKKQNPNYTQKQVDETFDKMVQEKKQENYQMADNKTQEWADSNKQSFMANAKKDKQPILEQRVNDLYAKEKQQYLNRSMNLASSVAKNISGGQSLGTFIDKDQFAQKMKEARMLQAKQDFKQANPTLEGEDFEKAWEEHAKQISPQIEMGTANAVNLANKLPISKGFSNKMALATQRAIQMTDAWANNPKNRQNFEKQFKEQFDTNPVNQRLKQENPDAYTEKLNNGIKQGWEQAIESQYNSNIKKAQDIITENTGNGVILPTSIGGIIAGTKGFAKGYTRSSGLGVTAIGKGIQYGKGFMSNSGSLSERHQGGVRQIYDYQYGDAPPEVKAKAYRDDVAYKAGILKGVSGYQKRANKAMQNNPYAEEMYHSLNELSEIERMAKKETITLPNGETKTRVAEGAVQLVVEKDRSYLQVLTPDNKVKTVSMYGAGDSTLNHGDTLFKDYNIENGQLVPVKVNSSIGNGFYAKDTSGHKVLVSKNVAIDANQLLPNRRHIIIQEKEPIHDAYNYKVDMGQFNINDIKTHSIDQKAILVLEKNRCYLAMNGEDNKQYRISPIYETGNPNLRDDQVIYKEYIVEGGKLREQSINKNIRLETYTYTPDGRRQETSSQFIPNDIRINEMIMPNENKRYRKRIELEEKRIKSGAYL